MRSGLFGSAQAKRGGPDADRGVSLRRFAHEVRPAFADACTLEPA